MFLFLRYSSRGTLSRKIKAGGFKEMKATITLTLIVISAVLLSPAFIGTAIAATNQATDPGGGGITLTNSNTVTVNATALQIVKQVYVNGTCMASSDTSGGADSCNGNTDTIVVPSGQAVEFLVFVRNTSNIQINDIRFQDDIDDAVAGFTYAGGNLMETTPIGSLPTDVETAANIYASAAAGTPQTDAVDTTGENFVSITDGGDAANLDFVTVGAVAGQVNETLNIPANTTFAVLIPVTKN
jgi:uncharacterized repeat protein (TIGR01451 family)